MIKLIAIDLDQTLLRANKTYDTERFENVVNQLLQQGVKVCIATGNSYHKIVEFFSKEMLQKLYFAGDNGNYLVYQDEVQQVTGLSRATYLAMANYFEEKEQFFVCISTGNVTYLKDEKGDGYDKIMKYNNKVQLVQQFSEIPEDELATKIAIYSPRSLAKNKTVAKHLSDLFDDAIVVTSGDDWIDAYSYQGGKGAAVQYFMSQFAIEAAEAMAFGDSLNDESMMKTVDYSVAMANGDADLKLHCQYIIGSNEEQSVIAIMEQLTEDLDANFMSVYKNKR